jgi:hypothetical protein
MRNGDVEGIDDAVDAGIDTIETGRGAVVVAACGYPELSVTVGTEAVEVDVDGDAVGLGEGFEVDDGDGVLIIGEHITAGIGDVYLIADDFQLVRLEANEALGDDFEGGGINFGDISRLLIVGVELYGAGVRGDVSVRPLKADVTAVGDVNLPNAHGGTGIHDFDLVGTVDDGIELGAVDVDVVTDVAQLLGDGGVSGGVDIALILAGGEVVIVEGGLVTAHITFVEEVKTMYIGGFGGWSESFGFGYEDGDVVAAGREERHGADDGGEGEGKDKGEEGRGRGRGVVGFHISTLTMSL